MFCFVIFLCFQLSVSGNNLLNICKLIFQISRSESNDSLFEKNYIIGQIFMVYRSMALGPKIYSIMCYNFLFGVSLCLITLIRLSCMIFLFLDSLLLVLKNEDVSVSGEALLYCVGTLKFLSGNAAILRLLLAKNCIGVAQELIQKLCMVEDGHMITAGHILVQVCLKPDHFSRLMIFVTLNIFLFFMFLFKCLPE